VREARQLAVLDNHGTEVHLSALSRKRCVSPRHQ
jgi:hypothetical protein